jgi:hypothetical protein
MGRVMLHDPPLTLCLVATETSCVACNPLPQSPCAHCLQSPHRKFIATLLNGMVVDEGTF